MRVGRGASKDLVVVHFFTLLPKNFGCLNARSSVVSNQPKRFDHSASWI
jgi:hypothetical protein